MLQKELYRLLKGKGVDNSGSDFFRFIGPMD
ncbi:hypothetical protein MANES_04G029850v8 [Manihot esculenta]|uniref:Uncharacterized protein n=1 Tax=Manihot esculenta TaxID=3983 RepID=A0ACB7HRC1_MANES|nr:hypothetical protein MANES_04G029850v8 [Manihot esculenta]